MIIVMASRKQEDIDQVVARIEELGYTAHLIQGEKRTVIAAVGDERGKFRLQSLESMPHVEAVFPILKPYKLAGREVREEPTVIRVSDSLQIGGDKFCVMAGPCAVENREQILESAEIVKKYGATGLRGGAFKPRTSPYSFQGLELEGLMLLAEARKATGLPIITEVVSPEQAPMIAEYADILQIGARNMQNYGLLRAVGKIRRPVMLKRGLMSNINEFLMAAEYIMSEGNTEVILCERGIRTFETETRNTLDISAVPVLKKLTHLPVIIDPSHGTGHWDLVIPVSKAAVAVGADGIIVEVHPCPEKALSDGPQSLKPERFAQLMDEIRPFVELTGRKL